MKLNKSLEEMRKSNFHNFWLDSGIRQEKSTVTSQECFNKYSIFYI